MSTENSKTLAVYNRYYQEFFAGCARRAASQGAEQFAARSAKDHAFWLDGFSSLPPHARILEIGSGDGLGTKALRDHGYDATPSDIVPGFLQAIRDQGLTPLTLDIIKSRPSGTYDGCLAWHVFVHFTMADAARALSHIYQSLRPGGRLVFDVQDRRDRDIPDGAWIDYSGDYHLGAKRFFQYHSEDSIRDLVTAAGFTIVKLDSHTSSSDVYWLRLIAEKPHTA